MYLYFWLKCFGSFHLFLDLFWPFCLWIVYVKFLTCFWDPCVSFCRLANETFALANVVNIMLVSNRIPILQTTEPIEINYVNYFRDWYFFLRYNKFRKISIVFEIFLCYCIRNTSLYENGIWKWIRESNILSNIHLDCIPHSSKE